MEVLVTAWGMRIKFDEIETATVEHYKTCSQVVVWLKKGGYAIADHFNTPEAAEDFRASILNSIK